MISVEKIETWGWEHALRGMRNPMNSWDKSDSDYECYDPEDGYPMGQYIIGDNDFDLMKRLHKAGHPHRKYLRQVLVSMDIVAPLYWWKEFDTYKVGTTANSCSTMHKIHAKEFELSDFSYDRLSEFGMNHLLDTIEVLNNMRSSYLDSGKEKDYWWDMIQTLPTNYNQKRTVTFTYENVMNMLDYRQNHRLDEWCEFCRILLNLPYVEELRNG